MECPNTEFFLARIKEQYCKKHTNMSGSFSSFGPKLNWQKTQEITIIQGFFPKIKRLFPKTQVFGKVLAFSTCSTQKLTSIDQNSMIFCWNSMIFYRNSSFFLKTQFFGKSTWPTCGYLCWKKNLNMYDVNKFDTW